MLTSLWFQVGVYLIVPSWILAIFWTNTALICLVVFLLRLVLNVILQFWNMVHFLIWVFSSYLINFGYFINIELWFFALRQNWVVLDYFIIFIVIVFIFTPHASAYATIFAHSNYIDYKLWQLLPYTFKFQRLFLYGFDTNISKL